MPSYEFELKPKELLRLLFFKKNCPVCKNKLVKNNEKTFLERGWDDGIKGLLTRSVLPSYRGARFFTKLKFIHLQESNEKL